MVRFQIIIGDINDHATHFEVLVGKNVLVQDRVGIGFVPCRDAAAITEAQAGRDFVEFKSKHAHFVARELMALAKKNRLAVV